MATSAQHERYIAGAEPFAQPILNHLRALIHRVCPECEEKMKWSFPHFDYRGQMMCSMAAFKGHVAFNFWKRPLLEDPAGVLRDEGMGSLGKLRSLEDLPSDAVLTGLLRQAMKLNEEGTVVKKPRKPARPTPAIPAELASALRKHKTAGERFHAFSPSMQREYIDWITEAKTEPTRDKRIATTLEWVAEGKQRNWKYEKK